MESHIPTTPAFAQSDTASYAAPATPTSSGRTSRSTASARTSARSSRTSRSSSRPNSEVPVKVPCLGCWNIFNHKSLATHYITCRYIQNPAFNVWACAICKGGCYSDLDAFISHIKSHSLNDASVPTFDVKPAPRVVVYVTVQMWVVTHRKKAMQRQIRNLLKGLRELDAPFVDRWKQVNGGGLVPQFYNFDVDAILEINMRLQSRVQRCDPQAFEELYLLLNPPLDPPSVADASMSPATDTGRAASPWQAIFSGSDAAFAPSRTSQQASSAAAASSRPAYHNAVQTQSLIQHDDPSRQGHEAMFSPGFRSTKASAGLDFNFSTPQATQRANMYSPTGTQSALGLNPDAPWDRHDMQQSRQPLQQYGVPSEAYLDQTVGSLASYSSEHGVYHQQQQHYQSGITEDLPQAGFETQAQAYMPSNLPMPNFSRPGATYTDQRYYYEQAAPANSDPRPYANSNLQGTSQSNPYAPSAIEEALESQVDEIFGSYAGPNQALPVWSDSSGQVPYPLLGTHIEADGPISWFDSN